MRIILLSVVFLLSMLSMAQGDQTCNELLADFFKTKEQLKIESSLVSSITEKYPNSPLSKIASDIASEVSKEIGCSLAEDKTTQAIEKIMDAFKGQISDYSKKRDEYIKMIGVALKKACSKADKLSPNQPDR